MSFKVLLSILTFVWRPLPLTSTFSVDEFTDLVAVTADEELGKDLKVKLSTLADPSTGTGTQVTALGGIYYARGNFVFTQDQSKIISKYTDNPTTDIGFKTVEETVTDPLIQNS